MKQHTMESETSATDHVELVGKEGQSADSDTSSASFHTAIDGADNELATCAGDTDDASIPCVSTPSLHGEPTIPNGVATVSTMDEAMRETGMHCDGLESSHGNTVVRSSAHPPVTTTPEQSEKELQSRDEQASNSADDANHTNTNADDTPAPPGVQEEEAMEVVHVVDSAGTEAQMEVEESSRDQHDSLSSVSDSSKPLSPPDSANLTTAEPHREQVTHQQCDATLPPLTTPLSMDDMVTPTSETAKDKTTKPLPEVDRRDSTPSSLLGGSGGDGEVRGVGEGGEVGGIGEGGGDGEVRGVGEGGGDGEVRGVGEGGGDGEGGDRATPSVSSSGYGGSREVSPEVGGLITEEMRSEEERLRQGESREGSLEREVSFSISLSPVHTYNVLVHVYSIHVQCTCPHTYTCTLHFTDNVLLRIVLP